MRINVNFFCAAFLLCLVASPLFADSNASGGGVSASETINLGAGPFGHDNPVGSPGSLNSIVNVNFTGGFVANRVRFIGTLSKVAFNDFASQNDIRITQVSSGAFFNWQLPGPSSPLWENLNYNNSQSITGSFAGGVDPNGAWTVTFYNSVEDSVAGVDSRSANVSMVFERNEPLVDSNGVFNAGTLTSGVPYVSVGEFAVAQPAGPNGNNDRYNFTLMQDGTLNIETFGANVFTGNINGDNEIGLFNATTGAIVPDAFDDDSGVGTYAALSNLVLAAGNYVLIVGDYDTNFSNTSTLSNLTFGSATVPYDYVLRMNFTAVPEPISGGLLAVGAVVVLLGRRRKA